MVYAGVEPETFFDGRQQPAGQQQEQHVHMINAWQAQEMFSKKYGR